MIAWPVKWIVVEGLADGLEIGGPFPHRLRPGAVGLLVAEVQEDDPVAVFVNELDRVHAAPDQPVQVGPELDVGDPLERSLQVVEVVSTSYV